MAIKKCGECGSSVSTRASTCPNCGAPVKKKANIGCLGLIIIIFILILVGHFFSYFDERSKAREQLEQDSEYTKNIAKIHQRTIDHFKANRDQIITPIKKALTEKNYESAVSQSKKYLVSGDKELKQIHTKAKTELILSELKGIPVKEYEKNKNLYQQLLNMHPDNALYKNKLAFYTEKVAQEKQKKMAAEARREKIERQFSGWDGSHRNLTRFIKESMNDPDSYEHVKTVYWDRGDHLRVRTTFRGKNAFGGLIKNTVLAKVSLDGQILQILDQY